jgi:RNA polymerase sigma factor (sigma-70 family)
MNDREQLGDFGSFYERSYPVALRVAYGIVGEQTSAEDATQDAFATAYRQRGRYRGDGPPEAWLYRIVVNTAIGALRHRRVRWIEPLDPVVFDRPAAELVSMADRAALYVPTSRRPRTATGTWLADEFPSETAVYASTIIRRERRP